MALSPFSPLVERAAELAAEWHDGTYRKGRWRPALFALPGDAPVHVPAMAHLSTVALTVMRAGFDDETVAAALLHDCVEDTNRGGERLRLALLDAALGPRVAALVAALSEPQHAADGSPLPWRVRKDAYLASLAGAPAEAHGISLADKVHNLWTTNEGLAAGVDVWASTPTRRGLTAGPAEQRWFYVAVLDASHRHDDPRLVPLRQALGDEVVRFDRWVATGNPADDPGAGAPPRSLL